MIHNLAAIAAIAQRDVVKLTRDPTRLVASVVIPVLMVAVLGGTLQANLGRAAGFNFVGFTFTGMLGLTLFQSSAQGLISLLEDRENDFSKVMFVAPVSRYSIVLGKMAGETMVASLQAIPLIGFAAVARIQLDATEVLLILPVAVLAALMGAAFGVAGVSVLSGQRGAQQVFGFIFLPQFFLAGIFNPINVLPLPLEIVSRVTPLRYAVDLIRHAYYVDRPEGPRIVLDTWVVDLAVCAGFFLVCVVAGTVLFVRNERNR